MEEEPDSAKAWLRLAKAQTSLGDFADALASLAMGQEAAARLAAAGRSGSVHFLPPDDCAKEADFVKRKQAAAAKTERAMFKKMF